MRPFLILLFAFVVGGCGSSGGGTPPAAVIEPDLEITADNAVAVATAAVRSAFDLQRVVYTGAHFLLTEPPQQPEPNAPATLGASLSVEVPGPQGGTAIFSWEDVQADGKYSTGDVFNITFDDYGADDQVLNGAMSIDNLRLLGVVTPDGVWMVDADLNVLSLKVRVGAQESVLNVAVPFHLENRVIVEVFEAELTQDLGFGPLILKQGNRMARLTSADNINYVFTGAVFSAPLDGLVTYYTTGTLGGFSFFADPSSGVMVVLGRKGMLELEAGFFTLTIRVDADGDEEYEAEINTSFSALLPV